MKTNLLTILVACLLVHISEQSVVPPPTNFTLVVDDYLIELYMDGVKVDISNVKTRLVNVGLFPLPYSTSQVSVHGQNHGGKCGMIGSDTSGLKFVTFKGWRCSNNLVPGWSDPAFDDTAWPAAVATNQTSYRWLKKTLDGLPLTPRARMIWTATCSDHQHVYCRSLRKDFSGLVGSK